jgi:hypothetical protein
MNVLEIIGGVAVALGVAGGMLSLPKQFDDFRRWRRPHGKKGVWSLVLRRDNTAQHIEVEWLFVGDLYAWMRPLSNQGGRLTMLEKVGEYYRVQMQFAPGTDLHYSTGKS